MRKFFTLALVVAAMGVASVGCGSKGSGSSAGGSGGSGGGDACQAAADDYLATVEPCPDYVAASGSASASGSTTCTEADGKLAQCVADCAAATSCECLGLDKSKMCAAADATKYVDCIGGC